MREIPGRCPCQDDPRIGSRQPLQNRENEEQFWRNLHTLTGLQKEYLAFERDEKARKDEMSGDATL